MLIEFRFKNYRSFRDYLYGKYSGVPEEPAIDFKSLLNVLREPKKETE